MTPHTTQRDRPTPPPGWGRAEAPNGPLRTATAAVVGLLPRDMPHPAQPSRKVLVFASAAKAVRHLGDHVLTAPECQGWLQVYPDFGEYFAAEDYPGRRRLVESAGENAAPELQEIYDGFADVVTREAQDARRLAWFAETSNSQLRRLANVNGTGHGDEAATFVAMGTAGILMVIERDLLTAFLPGQGQAQRVRQSPEDRLCDGQPRATLPREGGMRSGRPTPLAQGAHRRPSCDNDRRRAAWSADQRLYHDVFRVAVQFVRQAGRLAPKAEYHHLARVLPMMSRLKYENWRDLRAAAAWSANAPASS